jgi:predicted nucleic acid-binding protein
MMTKSRVYIETTIPSFYFETRTAPAIVARHEWTKTWWSSGKSKFEFVTSVAVIQELAKGPRDRSSDWLGLLADVPLLEINTEVMEIVFAYVRQKLMPADPNGDALHLAIASYHKCDFLVTWNCRHLANANKFGHIRRMNAILGLYVPQIVTPMELPP